MLEGTLDTIGESYCLLCETVAYPEDQSYVIFTLREEATFSDGTPVTAQDVLFSYEILRDEGLPSFRANLPNTIAAPRCWTTAASASISTPKARCAGALDGGRAAGLQPGQP
jgi:microcin C transport system substrate-binding protein